jgi:hypothetical protein
MAFTGGGRNLTIEACEIIRSQNDGLRLFNGHRGVLVRNTLIHQHVTINNADHCDVAQSAHNDRDGNNDDVVIEYNRFLGVTSPKRTQGLLFRSGWLYGTGANPIPGVTPDIVPHPEDYPVYAWKRWRIRHNYIEVDHTHGLFLCGHVDLECHGNLIRNITNVSSNSDKPGITLHGSNSGRCWNNVQAKPTVWRTTDTDFPGQTGDFSQWQITHLSSFADATVPVGWTMPTAGRYALD